ncbi:hypothetical protein PENTCL1PPCAC_12144, partial [Pristionchus entomophagus]
ARAFHAAKKHYGPAVFVNMTQAPSTSAADAPGLGSCESANNDFAGADSCIEWYRENALMMQVYINSMEVATYTQNPTYK